MPSVQIKNVPENVHRTLRMRAAANGQSLQQFLLQLLEDEARLDQNRAIFDRIDHGSGPSIGIEYFVEAIREARDR